MSSEPLQEAAEELCRIFLGWKLREDFDALLALGEGELRIDLLTGETSCDGDPLPPLFIAGELGGWLEGRDDHAAIQEASVVAVFAARTRTRQGREMPLLSITCHATIRTADASYEADANNAG